MQSGSKKLNALSSSPNQKRMHSYVVRITFWNALSSSPFQFLECTLMQSLSIFGVHSHLVPFSFWSALSFGPDQGWECRLIQSHPIKPIPKKKWPIQPFTPIHYMYAVYIDKINGDTTSWYSRGSALDYEILSLPEYGSDWGLRLVFELSRNTVFFI